VCHGSKDRGVELNLEILRHPNKLQSCHIFFFCDKYCDIFYGLFKLESNEVYCGVFYFMIGITSFLNCDPDSEQNIP
jgi:hypothetical protein